MGCPYHVILDCYAKTIILAMLGIPSCVVGTYGCILIRIFPYIQARRLLSRGCISFLNYVLDVSMRVLHLNLLMLSLSSQVSFLRSYLGFLLDMI